MSKKDTQQGSSGCRVPGDRRREGNRRVQVSVSKVSGDM